MHKTEFIQELQKQLNYEKEKCNIINDILESNFFINKKNKDKMIKELMQRLAINAEEASKVYDIAIGIVNDEIKYRLKNPFQSKD